MLGSHVQCGVIYLLPGGLQLYCIAITEGGHGLNKVQIKGAKYVPCPVCWDEYIVDEEGDVTTKCYSKAWRGWGGDSTPDDKPYTIHSQSMKNSA